MSSNGRGSMRPQNKSPPFLVIGLLVALVILGANYWKLSSNNASLSNEVSDLQDQLRLISSKKINADKRNENLLVKYREVESSLVGRDGAIKKKELEMSSLRSEITKKNEELQTLSQEKDNCNSNLKACQDNSDGIQQELQTLKEDIDNIKKSSTNTSAESCKSACDEKRKEILGQIEKYLGLQSLKTLQDNGVDVLDYKDKVEKLDTSQTAKPVVSNVIANQSAQPSNVNQVSVKPGQTNSPPQGSQTGGEVVKPDAKGEKSGNVSAQSQVLPSPAAQDSSVVNQKGSSNANQTQIEQPIIPSVPVGQVKLNPSMTVQGQASNIRPGVFGIPKLNQIQPPNADDMHNIMVNAVKKTVDESLHKKVSKTLLGSAKDVKEVTTPSEQSQVADTVKNEKEAEGTNNQSTNVMYDDDTDKAEEKKKSKNVNNNVNGVGREEYEEDGDEQDNAVNDKLTYKGKKLQKQEDSIDALRNGLNKNVHT